MEESGEPNGVYYADWSLLLESVPEGIAGLVYLDPPPPPDDLDPYLRMLGKVVQQSRVILSEQGNVALYTTPQLTPSLRFILDQVFGVGHFRDEITIPRRGRQATRKGYTGRDERILIYGKSASSTFNQPSRPLTDDEIAKRFSLHDARGPYRLDTLFATGFRPNLRFEWRGQFPPEDRTWRFTLDRLEELYADARIVMGDGKLPRLKVYLSEHAGEPVGSTWQDLPTSVSQQERVSFDYQQPLRILTRIIDMLSDANDWVIDPFCGSGTTLVASQREQRRWIGGDNSLEALQLASDRLTADCGQRKNEDFVFGDSKELSARFPHRRGIYSKVVIPSDLHSRNHGPRHVPYMERLNTDDVHALLEQPESEFIDFKSIQYPLTNDREKAVFLKDLLAFANTTRKQVAYIIVGAVENAGGGAHIEDGITVRLDDANLQQLVNGRTNRPLRFHYQEAYIDSKWLGLFAIDCIQARPLYLTKRFGDVHENLVYARRGTSTFSVPPDEYVSWRHNMKDDNPILDGPN